MKYKLKSDARGAKQHLAWSLGAGARRESNKNNFRFCRLLKSWARGLWVRNWVSPLPSPRTL